MLEKTNDFNKIQSECQLLAKLLADRKIETKVYQNEEIGYCGVDIYSKKISDNSKRIGLGEFEHFMSVGFNKRYDDTSGESPLITAMDKRKKDDTLLIPGMCKVDTLHSHPGKPPVIHIHMNCKKTDLIPIANYIRDLTRINEKNTDI